MTTTPWASIADVAEKTGVTVTTQERLFAVATLETMTGAIEDVSRVDISDRDLYWLKLAVCYQAAYVHDNPDLYSRADVMSVSQDGESASFRNPDAQILAPLARKALRRLSWRGLTRSGDRAPLGTYVNVNSEEYDDSLPWKAL